MINQIKNKIQLAAIALPIYAVETVDLTVDGSSGFNGLAGITIPKMVSALVALILIVVAVIFFFVLVLGGLKWIMSGGDEKKVAAARSSITNALIGLVIVFATYAIIKLIEYFFHINIIGAMTLPTF